MLLKNNSMKYKTRFVLFFGAMILFNLAANFAHPVTPTIIQNLQLHDYMFGVALAMMQLANFLMSPVWGKLNSKISSRLTLLIGCCGYGVAQLWFALATTELMIILARLFAGVFVGGIFVSFLTYVVNMADPKDQPKYLTWSATIQSVAGAFGYLVGGVLGEYTIKGTFLIQALCLVVTGAAFFFICLPDKQTEGRIQLIQIVKDANPFGAFKDCAKFMTLSFAMLFVVNILINFGNTGFDQAFNYYLKAQLNLTSSYNGIIKAAVGLVSFVANMTLCIWLIQKTDTKKSLSLLVGICALASVGTLVSPKIGIFITFSILVYAGYSVSLPVLQNMVASHADPAQKNLVMGFYNSTKSLGSIAGSLTAGFIYAIHPKLPFGCTALIYGLGLVAALIFLALSRKKHKN